MSIAARGKAGPSEESRVAEVGLPQVCLRGHDDIQAAQQTDHEEAATLTDRCSPDHGPEVNIHAITLVRL